MECGDSIADEDSNPTWIIRIPFKEGALTPAERALWGDSIQISSPHTPASLRAQHEFKAEVAKAIPIVVPVDIDYKECLLAYEAERVLEKKMEKLTIKDELKPKDATAKPKKKKSTPPPLFTEAQLKKLRTA